MSLSAWLKEYLYIPLGGNRYGRARTYLNLLIVMGLGGLWHGADWKFGVWGLWHGALLAIERLLGVGEPSRGVTAFVRMGLTFALVTFGWLFFRLASLSDVALLISQFAQPWRPIKTAYLSVPNVLMICSLTMLVALFHLPPRYDGSYDRWDALRTGLRPYVYACMFGALLLNGGTRNPVLQLMIGAVFVLFLIPLRKLGSYQRWDSQVSAWRPYALGFLFAAILMASGSRHAFIYFQF